MRAGGRDDSGLDSGLSGENGGGGFPRGADPGCVDGGIEDPGGMVSAAEN